MEEGGHAEGDGAQDLDGGAEALLCLVDRLFQEDPQKRGMRPSPSCERPRLRSAAVRVADEIPTFLREATIENRRIHRALAGMASCRT